MSYEATHRQPNYNDYDEGLNSEEEEEERLLSEQHGEASDDGPKRKRTQPTAFSEADAAAAKEFEEKVRVKKPRPSLKLDDLKGSKGLVLVRRSFPNQCKYREGSSKRPIVTGAKSSKVAQKMNQQAQITAAARYSRSLMSAYRSFARGLFPSLAPEDVLLKVEDMGSKKEIKDYLQIMRNEVRKEYLEGIYGVEKTERVLHELENGLSRPPVVEEEYVPVNRRMGHAVLDGEDSDGEELGNRGSGGSPVVVPNPYSKVTEVGAESVPGAAGSDVSETADDDEELEFVEEKEDVKETEDMEKDDEIVATESGTDEAVKESEKSHPMPEETEKVVEEEEIFDNSSDKKETTTAEENVAVASDVVVNEPVEESFVESEENTPFAETQETLTLVASQFGDEDFDDALEDTMEKIKNADEDLSLIHI